MKQIFQITLIFLCLITSRFSAQAQHGFYGELSGGMSYVTAPFNHQKKHTTFSYEFVAGYNAISPLRLAFSFKKYHQTFQLGREEKEYRVDPFYLDFHYNIYSNDQFHVFLTYGTGAAIAREVFDQQDEPPRSAAIIANKLGCGIDYLITSGIYFQLKYDYTMMSLIEQSEFKLVTRQFLVIKDHNFMLGIRYHI